MESSEFYSALRTRNDSELTSLLHRRWEYKFKFTHLIRISAWRWKGDMVSWPITACRFCGPNDFSFIFLFFFFLGFNFYSCNHHHRLARDFYASRFLLFYTESDGGGWIERLMNIGKLVYNRRCDDIFIFSILGFEGKWPDDTALIKRVGLFLFLFKATWMARGHWIARVRGRFGKWRATLMTKILNQTPLFLISNLKLKLNLN